MVSAARTKCVRLRLELEALSRHAENLIQCGHMETITLSSGLEFSQIVPVQADNLSSYKALRLRGLQEHPEAFGETAEGFQARSLEELGQRIAAQVALGGFILAAISKDGEMLATVGLSVDSSVKTHHRGLLWGMYVLPEARGQQVGKKLIQELLDRAIGLGFLEQIHLSVVTSNTAAVHLYRSKGFVVYGTDPRVLKVNGEFFDEYLMCKRLDGATPQ